MWLFRGQEGPSWGCRVALSPVMGVVCLLFKGGLLS